MCARQHHDALRRRRRRSTSASTPACRKRRSTSAPEWPDLERYAAAAPPRARQGRHRQRPPWLLENAQEADHADRPRPTHRGGAGTTRIALAERLGACVFTDLKSRLVLPDRPSAARPARRSTSRSKPAREAAARRRTSSWRSTGSISAARCAGKRPASSSAKVIRATLDQHLHNGCDKELPGAAADRRASCAATPDALSPNSSTRSAPARRSRGSRNPSRRQSADATPDSPC